MHRWFAHFGILAALAGIAVCSGCSAQNESGELERMAKSSVALIDGCTDQAHTQCTLAGCGCLNNVCTSTPVQRLRARQGGRLSAERRTYCEEYSCGCSNNMCSGGACTNPTQYPGMYTKVDGCTATERNTCASQAGACLNKKCSGPPPLIYRTDGCSDTKRLSCAGTGCGCQGEECSGGSCGYNTGGCTEAQINAFAQFGCGSGGYSAGPAVHQQLQWSRFRRRWRRRFSRFRSSVRVTTSPSDTFPVTKVEFYDNGALVGTDSNVADSPFRHQWSITNANNGTRSWVAKAYNGTAMFATAAVSVTVNIPSTLVPSTVTVIPNPTASETKGSDWESGVPASSATTSSYLAATNIQKVNMYRTTVPLPNGQSPSLRPTLVFVHGGGWSAGSCTTGANCPDPLARRILLSSRCGT